MTKLNPQNFSVEALNQVSEFYKQSFNQLSQFYADSFSHLMWFVGGFGAAIAVVVTVIIAVQQRSVKKKTEKSKKEIDLLRGELEGKFLDLEEKYNQKLRENLEKFRQDYRLEKEKFEHDYKSEKAEVELKLLETNKKMMKDNSYTMGRIMSTQSHVSTSFVSKLAYTRLSAGYFILSESNHALSIELKDLITSILPRLKKSDLSNDDIKDFELFMSNLKDYNKEHVKGAFSSNIYELESCFKKILNN